MSTPTTREREPCYLLRLPLADYQLLLDVLRHHQADPRITYGLLPRVVALVTIVQDRKRSDLDGER